MQGQLLPLGFKKGSTLQDLGPSHLVLVFLHCSYQGYVPQDSEMGPCTLKQGSSLAAGKQPFLLVTRA